MLIYNLYLLSLVTVSTLQPHPHLYLNTPIRPLPENCSGQGHNHHKASTNEWSIVIPYLTALATLIICSLLNTFFGGFSQDGGVGKYCAYFLSGPYQIYN